MPDAVIATLCLHCGSDHVLQDTRIAAVWKKLVFSISLSGVGAEIVKIEADSRAHAFPRIKE